MRRSLPVEHPAGPLPGYKLACPVLSADSGSGGFTGVSIGRQRVYGQLADATCLWSARHAPPKRHCSCGFYSFHTLEAARAMACDTRYRRAVILEVAASGRFIRHEEGLRYARQRVRAMRVGRCRCGRPAVALIDTGAGLPGWRRLKPACASCVGWASAITFPEFAAGLENGVSVVSDEDATPPWALIDSERSRHGDELPFSVVAAEVALLQARVDDLQVQLARMSGD